MAKDGLVLVGEVVKPHGVRGELRIVSFADSPFLFDVIRRVVLKSPGVGPDRGKSREFALSGGKEVPGGMVLRLIGVGGRDEAESLRGSKVYVFEDDLPKPAPDEFYLHSVIGARVFLDGPGELIGVLASVEEVRGQEIWSIIAPDGREALFPARTEFVRSVDVEAGNIRIDPPKGWYEIYLGQE